MCQYVGLTFFYKSRCWMEIEDGFLCYTVNFIFFASITSQRFLYETKQQQIRITFLHHCKLKKLVASQNESQKSAYTHPYTPPKVSLESKSNLSVSLQFWAVVLMGGLRDGKSNLLFATVLGDRQHVFDERVVQRQMKFAFRYSFARSTPRFCGKGCAIATQIRVSLQFQAIDTTFSTKRLITGRPRTSCPAE